MTEMMKSSVGVIVARFQVPKLHVGHRYLIDYVLKRHEKVLVILGVAYMMSDRNPLSFEMRKGMLEKAYPGRLTIVPSDSLPSSYKERSRKVDEIVIKTFPGFDAVFYGSRDSFIHTYEGSFNKQEVPTVYSGDATHIRKNIEVINSSDFRSGVIYSAIHRKRVGYPTVDVAIINYLLQRILLVGKEANEGKLCFPGVFFDPEVDESYEEASIRCIGKETPGIFACTPEVIQSYRIDDWRVNKTRDGVITMLFISEYIGGEAIKEKVPHTLVWASLDNFPELLVSCHKPLGEIIKKKIA